MPSGGWYPSMVANVQLSFDESLTVVEYPEPVSVADNVRAATLPDPSALVTSNQLQVKPLVVRDENGATPVSFVMNRVPLSGSVELPGYRQAGQFNLTFNYKDFPIDPRAVRAAAVEIHLGSVSPDDFAQGMRHPEPNGTRRSIIGTRDAAGKPNAATLLMSGMVDDWQVTHSNGGSHVQMRGRDMRGVLLDTPIAVVPNGLQQLLDQVDLSLPIDKVVAQILRFNPFFEQFAVVVNPAEWPNGVVPAPGSGATAPRHRRGANGLRASARPSMPSTSTNLSFWDLIVQFCYLVGAIPYFRGLALNVRPARTIYDQARGDVDPVQFPTPFLDGLPRAQDRISGAAITPELRWRQVVYGRDVSEMQFDRKYAGFQRPRVVRAVSVDNSSTARGEDRVIQAFWPPAPASTPHTAQSGRNARRTRVAPSGQQSQEEQVTVPVPGVRTVQQLEDIARSVYEEIGRGEVGGTIVTRNLSSFGGDNADPDLLRLQPGDGIELLTDVRSGFGPSPLVSTYTDDQRESFDAQIRRVSDILGDKVLARVLVATARGQVQELQRYFRVQNVKYGWDGKGVKVSFDFQNYVVARNQVEQADPAVGAAVRTNVPASGRRR